MPDVVRCEVHLDAVFADSTFWEEHDTCVVDEDVDCGHVGQGKNLCRCGTDGLLAGEIELEGSVVHGGVSGFKCINALLEFGWGAA